MVSELIVNMTLANTVLGLLLPLNAVTFIRVSYS